MHDDVNCENPECLKNAKETSGCRMSAGVKGEADGLKPAHDIGH